MLSLSPSHTRSPQITNKETIDVVSVSIVGCLNKHKIMLPLIRIFHVAKPLSRSFSVSKHVRPGASVPLVENYRRSWPNTQHELPEGIQEPELPKRTVDDSALRFKLNAKFDFGSSLFYSNLDYHPADFKVSLMVKTDDLGLNEEELRIFQRMVGPRYNPGRKEVKLTCKRFPNRIENKRYLVYLLETLLAEARNLSAMSDVQKYEE